MPESVNWVREAGGGIEVDNGSAFIDPSRPQPVAIVTHGHADHARAGHGHVFATPQTLAIMRVRYGVVDGTALEYGESVNLGGTRVTLFPAGHVLGSAQVLLERNGQRVVITGDFKRAPDPTCVPFQLVPCDVFITEATFGLPVFRHPPVREEILKAISRLAEDTSRCLLIGVYALGKAQRVICALREAGYADPIYIHGALERLCALYRDFGVELGELQLVSDSAPEHLAGKIVLAPPSALRDRWARRLPDPVLALASGWLQVRQRVRQSNIDLPLVISDHADWDELTTTISELSPREVWVTHGSEAALVHWCQTRQIAARALSLVGRSEEGDA